VSQLAVCILDQYLKIYTHEIQSTARRATTECHLSHRYGETKVFLSKKTLNFRKKVRDAWENEKQEPLVGRLGFRCKTCSRSRRRHDLDNVLKSIWNALEQVGV